MLISITENVIFEIKFIIHYLESQYDLIYIYIIRHAIYNYPADFYAIIGNLDVQKHIECT